jgi:hypothetical protein
MSDVNQCDGCRQGLRLVDGLHYNGSGRPWISCTADRYGSPVPSETGARREEGDALGRLADQTEGEPTVVTVARGALASGRNADNAALWRAYARDLLACYDRLASRTPAEDRAARERLAAALRVAAHRERGDLIPGLPDVKRSNAMMFERAAAALLSPSQDAAGGANDCACDGVGMCTRHIEEMLEEHPSSPAEARDGEEREDGDTQQSEATAKKKHHPWCRPWVPGGCHQDCHLRASVDAPARAKEGRK